METKGQNPTQSGEYSARGPAAGDGRATQGATRPLLLLSLIIIVIVSGVLLLSQEDPGVGMAP
jgi:hypothetical protein